MNFLGGKVEDLKALEKAKGLIVNVMNPLLEVCAESISSFVGHDLEIAIKDWPGDIEFPDGRKVKGDKDLKEWWLKNDIENDKFAILFHVLRYGTYSKEGDIVKTSLDPTKQETFLKGVLKTNFGVSYCDDEKGELVTKNGKRTPHKGGFLDTMVSDKRADLRRMIDPFYTKRCGAKHNYNVRRHVPKIKQVSKKRAGAACFFDLGANVLLKGVPVESLTDEDNIEAIRHIFSDVAGLERVMGKFMLSSIGRKPCLLGAEMPPESSEDDEWNAGVARGNELHRADELAAPKTPKHAVRQGSEQVCQRPMEKLHQENKFLKSEVKELKSEVKDLRQEGRQSAKELREDVKSLQEQLLHDQESRKKRSDRSAEEQGVVKKLRLDAENVMDQQKSRAGKPTEEALVKAAMAKKKRIIAASNKKVRNSVCLLALSTANSRPHLQCACLLCPMQENSCEDQEKENSQENSFEEHHGESKSGVVESHGRRKGRIPAHQDCQGCFQL